MPNVKIPKPEDTSLSADSPICCTRMAKLMHAQLIQVNRSNNYFIRNGYHNDTFITYCPWCKADLSEHKIYKL